ncbi:uncharacterized protein [Panulirus ornatus]|uniref:uncharacterized protein n=1 Tax=Panulirus ornatus TaxID=150431 RepID=UPI003A858940
MTWLLNLFLLAATASLPRFSLGYQTGCPILCQMNPIPLHSGSGTDNTKGEYAITVEPAGNGQYDVTLKGPSFQGFVMNVNGGQFITDNSDNRVELCSNGHAAITQSAPHSRNSITVRWVTQAEGVFTFGATVVQDFNKYVNGITFTLNVTAAGR